MPEFMPKKRWLHGALTALIAVAALSFLLRQIDWRAIPQTLARLPLSTLLGVFLLYLILVFIKAWRLQMILGIQTPLRRLFPILALQTFWTNLLPMRTGDLSYVYLLKQGENVAASKGFASLIVGSVIDMLLMLGMVVGLGSMFYARFEGVLSVTTLFILPGIGMLMLAGLSVPALLFPQRVQRQLDGTANHIRQRLGRFHEHASPAMRRLLGLVEWFLERVLGLVSELVQRPRGRRILAVLGVSMLSMGLRFGLQWILIRGMGIGLGLPEVCFALAFTGFCNLFPIQNVAGLGAVEAPWTWALVNLGATSQGAIVAGFSLHLIVLIYSICTGIVGWALRRV